MMCEEHYRLWEYSGEYLAATDISEILIRTDGVYFRLTDNDILLTCLQGDERSMPMDILNFLSYEKKNLEIIDRVLEMVAPSGIYLDIGGNIGYTSLHWSRRFPESNIYTFEVLKPTYDVLIRNVEANGARNIIAFNYGVSNASGKTPFVYYPWCTANSSMNNLQNRKDAITLEAEVVRLDEFDRINKLPVDFVKMDVEGAEKLAIEGMMSIFERNHPVFTCESLRSYSARFGYHPNDILATMRTMGYCCLTLDEDEECHEIFDMSETMCRNFVFLHRDKHADALNMIMG